MRLMGTILLAATLVACGSKATTGTSGAGGSTGSGNGSGHCGSPPSSPSLPPGDLFSCGTLGYCFYCEYLDLPEDCPSAGYCSNFPPGLDGTYCTPAYRAACRPDGGIADAGTDAPTEEAGLDASGD
jgi:hypothetical protein